MVKNYLIVISLVLLGCDQDPVAVGSSNNPNVKVDELFTHKECTVYRASLDGRHHYFTGLQQARYDNRTFGQLWEKLH